MEDIKADKNATNKLAISYQPLANSHQPSAISH